jgi:hypothetical protein
LRQNVIDNRVLRAGVEAQAREVPREAAE